MQMDTVGERLRAERERLGLSQAALGELGGVQKLAQINYEKDKRKPDSGYLAAVAEAGVDVLYVLTGMRSDAIPVPKIEPMSKREQALIANYRNSTEEGKRALEGAASATAHMDRGEKRQGGE